MKSVAKTGQPSIRVFEIEIFGEIRVYTGLTFRPLRVKVKSSREMDLANRELNFGESTVMNYSAT